MIKKGKTRRTWVGFNTIIGGYIVISKAPIKEEIKKFKKNDEMSNLRGDGFKSS